MTEEEEEQNPATDMAEKMSVALDFEVGGGNEEASEEVSQTLGEEDTFSLSEPVGKEADQGASSIAGVKGEAEVTQKEPRKPFASLFSNNRLPSEGSKLKFFKQDQGRIKITEDDIREVASTWEHCLVGYFGGKHPGKQALNHIVKSWKVQVTTQQHGSGWIIFNFQSKDELATVLENGPYIIYGRPLLLKTMPRYFGFGYEAISCFPVWVQLRNVPLDLWHSNVFGKICSLIGRPIHMDKLTSTKARTTYARCLVEVDLAKELTHSVTLDLPGEIEYEQAIFYENLPRYCPHCKMMGHTKESCKKAKPSDNAEKAIESKLQKGKASEKAGLDGGNQNGISGEGTSKGMEWVIKKTKGGKTKMSTEVGKNPGAQTANQFSILETILENEGNQTQESEADDQDDSEVQEQAGLEEEVQTIPETEDCAILKVQNQVEPEPNSEDRIQADGANIGQASIKSIAKKKQEGEAVYVQQATQIASEEIQSNLKQTTKGSTGAATIKSAIGEEGKKRRNKKNKLDWAEFCAGMGGDSPNPIIQ